MPEKWTKRSRPPPSGVMNPKPFSSENHLTVPVLTDDPTCCSGAAFAGRDHFDRPVRPVPTDADAIQTTGLHATRIRLWGGSGRGGGLASRRGDLLAIPRRGVPRELQRVPAVARDDVQMEEEDGLPGCRAAGVEEVHAV